ncbi:BZ3500_MvSof-1268-A1-R1_Chr7-1g09320 [Microbotryum saponariae]|uniref:BZ3500_MvSof-1268-A1-R1_Chr7-1g09320 protein n=1 Tax=Microbotryum saponariae TaxID=289078 RepID=A0A2X0LRP5_9BASI|nr:BZ3501_MvSof-1269-A2-R1_Chr7-1g09025 [Microbotryum saponariae]SDA03228.1 BZ3500_MvSof-1268-A1-R1_Chr7-1g09320 [Microbotryum saponariae]
MSVNPPRFEPQGSYFDQYPDRRTRLNSYAAPIPTHSKTPAESTITTPRRAGSSSRGPVNLIHASELSKTSFTHRFSSPPQAPPADLALLQRARRGSANGASSFSNSSAAPLSLSSLERPKRPITSPSEASIYRAFTSESSRRRLSSPPHTTRPIDHDSKKSQAASSEKRFPPPSRSTNKGVHDSTKAPPGNGIPTTTSTSTLHHFKRIDRVPFPILSSKPNKARRTEAIAPDAMSPPAQAPLTFLVHPDRPKANRPAGVNYLLSVPTTPRSGSTSFSSSLEGTVQTERGDDQHSMTSSTSANSRRFSLIAPGSRIGKLFSLRSISSLRSSPAGMTSNTSLSNDLPSIQPGRKSSTSLRGLSTRGLGTTGVHSGSPKSTMIDLFAGPGVYDPLQGVYRSSSTVSSSNESPLLPKPSQYPGLPVPPDEFGSRVASTRGVSAPPDLDGLIANMNGRVIGGSRGGACSSSRKKNRSLLRSEKGSDVEASARVGDDARSRGEIERRESIPDIPTPPELERAFAPIDRDRSPHRQVNDPIPEGPIFGGVVRPSPLPRAPSARSSQGFSRNSSPPRERYSFVAPMWKSVPVERQEFDPNESGLDFPAISSTWVEDVSTSTNASEPSAPDAITRAPEPAATRTTPILSIDEIVRQHAGASYLSKLTASIAASAEQSKEGSTNDGTSSPATTHVGPSNDVELKPGLSMCLSLADHLEARDTDEIFLDMTKLSTLSASDDTRSILSTKSSQGPQGLPRPRLRKLSNPTFPSTSSLQIERELAQVLRSSKLTRLITLQRPPNLGLIISYADVGSPQGHPVLIHLGLGCVRHIIALYDELARAYDLRLICVDRWGLGRSSEVPDSKRGFGAWALVMEEVVERLGLDEFSILAHSAGGSFAIASALSPASSIKVKGSLHLLAPWILSTSSSTSNSTSNIDPLSGPYKLLKYVPSGVLKTAQLAEWKLTARKLGKPPTVQHAAIGYDAREGKVRWVGGRGEGRMMEDDEEEGQDGVQADGSTDRDSIFSGARPRRTSTFSLKSRSCAHTASPPSPLYDEPHTRDPNTSSHPSSTCLIPPTLSGPSLIQGLLRASHAESLRGSTADLALLLGNRSSKVPAEGTERVPDPMNLAPGMKVKIWLGEKDERISLGSVRGLQVRLGEGRCVVKVVEGADHGLITNAKVIGEVFESIAEEWKVTSSRGTGT